jgi:acyl phosphate:glycerol-3-phosphate acyltransferase
MVTFAILIVIKTSFVDILQQPIILNLLYALFGYLLGSLSTSIITCKLMGLPDPRTVGSNNPGATNVLRSGGKKAAAITLIGDMLKGVLPVLIVISLDASPMAIAITGLSAFLGHVFPVYYQFKGGKGVATLLGVLLGTSWMAGLGTIAVWLLVAFTLKYSSLSALVAALLAPVQIWYFTGSTEMTICTALMSLILFWRHKSNIQNLLSGKENKIGVKK